MRKLLLSGVICLLPAGVAIAACEDNLAFLDADQGNMICRIEAGLPFAVGERSIGGDLIYFLAKKTTFKGKVKLRQGQAFEAGGKPFSSEAKARSAAERIAKRQGCDLADMSFSAGVSLAFTLGC